MQDRPVTLEVFDPLQATDDVYVAFNVFSNRMQTERLPDEPPVPLEQTIRQLRNPFPLVEDTRWLAWDDAREYIIAASRVSVSRTDDNKHIAEFQILVLPEHRRQGIATQMLESVSSAAAAEERSLLFGQTWGSVPAGEAFMTEIGGTPGQAQHINQLLLAEVDRDLLRVWQERAAERASQFELGLWEGRYPEDELETVASMFEGINLVPRDDLDLEDFHVTADQIRQMDEMVEQRGFQRWTMYVRDPSTGKVAGFTEVMWNPAMPDVMHQEGTVVFKEYQNRGIGRWLKAAMLEKVLRERPEATRVHTGNADSNAPMLGINTRMGFKPYSSSTIWQVPLEKARSYLGSKSRPIPASQ